MAYLKIILHAHLYHNFPQFIAAARHPYFEIVLLGMRIRFFNYPSLLQLFEEIFIREIYFFKSLSDAPFIIDCGSNIGLSVLYFKKKYPASSIIAFEPDGHSGDLLKYNIESNQLSGIILKNVAIAAAAGERVFFQKKNEKGSVNNSLIKSGQHDASAVIKTELLSDHIFQTIDFLKIDTEGAEGEILKDLCTTGKIKLIDQIFVEFHHQCDMPFSEMERLMAENGLVSYLVNNESVENRQIVYKRSN